MRKWTIWWKTNPKSTNSCLAGYGEHVLSNDENDDGNAKGKWLESPIGLPAAVDGTLQRLNKKTLELLCELGCERICARPIPPRSSAKQFMGYVHVGVPRDRFR